MLPFIAGPVRQLPCSVQRTGWGYVADSMGPQQWKFLRGDAAFLSRASQTAALLSAADRVGLYCKQHGRPKWAIAMEVPERRCCPSQQGQAMLLLEVYRNGAMPLSQNPTEGAVCVIQAPEGRVLQWRNAPLPKSNRGCCV